MRRGRRITPEASVVSAIRDGARWRGWHVVRIEAGDRDPRGRGKAPIGCPDLAILLPGGLTLWVEVKAPKGRVRVAQLAFGEVCRKLGVPWCVARSWEDVVRVVAGLAPPGVVVPGGGEVE